MSRQGEVRPVVRPDAFDEAARQLSEVLARTASRAKDSGRALWAVLRVLCTTFRWDAGEAWVPSRDGTVLKPGPSWPRAQGRMRHFRTLSRKMGFLTGAGLPGRVWTSRTSLLIEDLEQDIPVSFTRRAAALEAGLRSALALPVLTGEEVVAVLVLFRNEPTAADADATRRIADAIAPLGPILARKRVEVELSARERQQRAVAGLGLRALAESTEPDRLIREALSLVASVLEVEHAAYLDHVPETGGLRLRAGVGWKPELEGRLEVPGGTRSQAGYTLLCGEPVILADIDREQRFELFPTLREHGVVSGVSVVVHGRGSPLGVLSAHARQRRNFTPDDLHFLQAMANVLAAAIERARVEEQLGSHRRQLEKLVLRRTEQLEASQERLRTAERLASIGTLAAGLGHDLGNTILPVLCRLDALAAGPLSPAAREDVVAVRTAVEYLRELSQGLRLFALDPGDDGAAPLETVLGDWWRSVSPLVRNALPRRIELTWDLPEALPPLAVPAHRLSQAVLNLVSNAAEAIEGDGHVRVWAREDAEGGRVRLAVSDDGRGMSPEVRRHSLDPFFTTKRRGLSTGLGLALVHGVAQACGGAVEIESTEGQGTTVVLALPVRTAAAAGGGREAEGDRPTAAVALTDPRVAAYTELLLRSAGMEVVVSTAQDPGDSQIWITEPSEATLRTARSYLSADPRRRVVFYGELPGGRREPGCITVAQRSGPDVMRRTLRHAVYQLQEGLREP